MSTPNQTPRRAFLLRKILSSFQGAQAAGFRIMGRIYSVSSIVAMKIGRLLAHPVAIAMIAGFIFGTICTEYVLQFLQGHMDLSEILTK